MESYPEANGKIIDPTVGGLVWVRRRNGSWWPGRILGPDELPESCLVSPRSGTPVKLLGREDASVDWYNLEKSKRVKAFRCGEYDECIEKAKFTAANSCKKAVKYARREDAILHALELESARLSRDCQDTCSDGKQGDAMESPLPFHPNEETEVATNKPNSLEDNSHELSPSGVSFEEPSHIIEQSVHGRRRRTPNDSEDDEGSKKRMRGLEDLGVGGTSSFKRRRSQVAHVHEFLKKKNRRRQLTKVLESTAMVTVPVMCEHPNGAFLPGVSESKVSGIESNEQKRSYSAVINNNSDSTGDASNNATGHASLTDCKQKENEISSMSGLLENDSSERLFDVPLIGEEKHTTGLSAPFVSSASQKPQMGAGAQSSQSSLVETMSLGNDEIHESGSISSGAAGIDNISHRLDNEHTSEWKLKGKRNSRIKTKIKKEILEKFTDADILDDKANVASINPGVKSEQVIEPHSRGPTINGLPPQRLMPYRQSRFTVNPKYQSSDLAYRKHDPGTLYDVNVEVKASHRPQHVPYISLMSKSTGKPIIGHPLLVEVLDNGVSDLLLTAGQCYNSSSELRGDVLGENVDLIQEMRSKSGAKACNKSPKKHTRNGVLLSKKIRRLSSLTSLKRPSDEEKKPVLLMEKVKGPSVACVPLKVVFSRINAALS